MINLTPELVFSWGPCEDYTQDVLESLLGDGKTPLEIIDGYEAAGVPADDVLWLLLRPEIVPERELHLLACDYAAGVVDIYERAYPNDLRPRTAIETKRRWVDRKATDDELSAARSAARDAARAAWYARDISRAAAWAVWAARNAAGDSAWAAAGDSAWAARDSVWAARNAAGDSAWAARDAAVKKHVAMLRVVLDRTKVTP